MSMKKPVIVFGEVLHDCFPDGPPVLGGAPFNVAWHLQALGDAPCFVSRIGDDERGRSILDAMQGWGMDAAAVQVDAGHATGWVDINMVDGEPQYTITPDVAYDFIDGPALSSLPQTGILYHGSLALRKDVSRAALETVLADGHYAVFLDVNLRAPWWDREAVLAWLARARWAKMNEGELNALGFDAGDVRTNMEALQAAYPVEQVIVTRGNQGVLVRHAKGTFHEAAARAVARRVDTVGAGDAFSALYLHGVRAGWPLRQTVERARDFAETIIGIRGATPPSPAFYQDFKGSCIPPSGRDDSPSRPGNRE